MTRAVGHAFVRRGTRFAINGRVERPMTSMNPTPVTVVACVMLLGGFGPALHAGATAEHEHEDSLIALVVEQANRSDVTLRATRALRAGTASGKHQGWMEVQTVATPAGGFSWSVLDEGGSERTRTRVFRELLETEAQAWRAGTRDAAALTPDNYVFSFVSRNDGRIVLRLQPKRRDARLIDGTLTVREDGSPIQLEGWLAKSPSFWVKRVHVVKRFTRLAGLTVPTSIESVADVKLVGQATFSMDYRYHEINGRPINAVARAASPH